MWAIVCLDDRDGMLFHQRRQSRDREVLRDILEGLEGRRLWIRPISRSLFSGCPGEVLVEEDPFSKAGEEDVCFVEDVPLAPVEGRLRSLTVYRWNRRYPGDVFLDLPLENWRLTEQEEFPGFSHEKITMEVYVP